MPIDESRIALSLLPNIGFKTLNKLLAHFESTNAILRASKKDLMQVKGIGQKTAEAIVSIDMDTVRQNIGTWQNAGVRIMTCEDKDYPPMIENLEDKPLILFARGVYHPEQIQAAVAIVGTRRPAQESQSIAKQLGERYAQQGWTVVSGMALGIDTQAHQGALSAGTSHTIAVLGGGVLNIYPPENQKLAEAIMQNGAILSENAPEASSTAPRLITRNRIISGLCQRVIVVQSDSKGGAMHAARAGFKQERALYTIDRPQFSGNQALLKGGASAIDMAHHDIPRVASI